MSKSKPAAKAKAKPKPTAKSSVAPANVAPSGVAAPKPQAARMLPTKGELKSLYLRYTENGAFDDHDKAFYFVLDVGGISRARQLLAHVEEVLAELEEFQP